MPRPVAFMSYVRFEDQHENGRLTTFRERLSAEVRMQTGEEFPIFQDRNDIKWGQNWKERLEESLDEVTFLIPIITPSFFKSPYCREELQRFLEREKQLGRSDLVLPVYYVRTPILDDEAKRAADELAQAIAAHQYADWRDLRFEPLTTPLVGKTLAQMATQIAEALERVQEFPQTSTPVSNAIRNVSPSDAGSIEGSSKTNTPSPKTEPPTRVVDPLHRGDHVTITEAIEAAKPGDRILVRPGFYQEGLVIDKPLEIIGDGPREEIVVQAIGKDVILFKATMGRVTNLTLRQIGGEGKWYGVDIAQGRLDLEDCDITSQSLACIAIHHGADPHVRRNRIHGGKQSGVFIYDNGQGILEENDIFENAVDGISIKTASSPTIRRNRIHDDKEAGVYLNENGQGILEENEIFGNALGGIAIETGGNPIVRHNRINKNGYQGIWVREGGAGAFEDNDLRGNASGAWDIAKDSLPNVKRARNIEK